jgi:hypothetical protein
VELVVMAVKPAMSAKVQRGIRKIIRETIRETTIEKRRMSESALIPSGEGIPPGTA